MAFLAMEGLAARVIPRERFECHLPFVLTSLDALHLAVREGPMTQVDLERELLEPLREFEEWCSSTRPELIGLCHQVVNEVDGLLALELPLVPQHGDFSLGNVLIKRDGRAAVIDWEEFSTVRAPRKMSSRMRQSASKICESPS